MEISQIEELLDEAKTKIAFVDSNGLISCKKYVKLRSLARRVKEIEKTYAKAKNSEDFVTELKSISTEVSVLIVEHNFETITNECVL